MSLAGPCLDYSRYLWDVGKVRATGKLNNVHQRFNCQGAAFAPKLKQKLGSSNNSYKFEFLDTKMSRWMKLNILTFLSTAI